MSHWTWSRRSRLWDPVVSFGKSVQREDAWQTLVPCSCRRRLTTTAPSEQEKNIATTKKKRKRPTSLSAYPKSPTTTRERVRWLQEHNAVLTDHYYAMKSRHRAMEDWGTTAEERLTFLRNKIYSFWRSSSSSNGSKNDPSAVSGRPRKPTLQMDSKWWFWNILFALFPAFLVACYCEFIGKPDLMEYNRIMHIAAQKDLLGDEYNQEEDEQLKLLLQDSETFASKAYDAVRDLTMYFLGQLVPEGKQSMPPLTTNTESHSAQTTRSVTENTVRATTVSPHDSEDAAAIDELKRKLEELELRLKERQGGNDAPQPTAPPKHSRIHSRILHQRRQETLDIAAKNELAKTAAGSTSTTQGINVEEKKKPSIWERLNMVANQFLGTEESGSSSSPPQPESPEVASLNTQQALRREKAEPAQSSAVESSSHATMTGEVVAATRDPQTRKASAPNLAPQPLENGPAKPEHEEEARKSNWWTNIWPKPK